MPRSTRHQSQTSPEIQPKAVFLDWDGTMTDSTSTEQTSKLSKRDRAAKCAQLDDMYVEFFQMCQEKGDLVYIVTNASTSWFMDTIKEFPKLRRYLARHDWKRFISARDEKESTVKDYKQWKYHTFRDILSQDEVHENHSSLVCISDLEHDLDNCNAVTDRTVQNIKIPHHATLDVLIKEWKQVLKDMKHTKT